MLLAVLLQSACLPTCHINVALTKHLPVEDLLSVLKAAGGMLLHSLSPSLSLTRNHLKLYWLWFASSALFPPVLCLCLSSIITTVLCSGSFCLISLPSIALIFFLFPLIVVCFITSMLPLISFYFFAPLNTDWGQRSQRMKCLNQVYREAYISLFLSPGSFKGVQQFCFLFFLCVTHIQKQQLGRFKNLHIAVSTLSEEVLWQRLSKMWCSHENCDGADDVEDAKSHQEEAVYDGRGELPLLRQAELPVLLLHAFD